MNLCHCSLKRHPFFELKCDSINILPRPARPRSPFDPITISFILAVSVIIMFLFFCTEAKADVEQSIANSDSSNVGIPDYVWYGSYGEPGYTNKSISVTDAPENAKITKIEVTWGIYHPRRADIVVELSSENSNANFELFQRESGTGSYTDSELIYSHFDGEPVNQTYYLNCWDWQDGQTGYIDFFNLNVYYVNSAPDIEGTPSFNNTSISIGDWSEISVLASDPGDNIKVYLICERDDGTNRFEEEIYWDSFWEGDTHRYKRDFQFNSSGVWRWRVYAIDSANQKYFYPSSSGWSVQKITVLPQDNNPTIHSASFLPTEITAGESAVATVEASDPGDEITVHLIAERTDGSSHFDIEIGWDSFVGNDVHKYQGPFRLDDAGVWHWKVYAQDQAGNRAYYPSETQWASQAVQVNAIDVPPTIHSASFLPTEITAGESAVATVEASDPGDQIAVHLIAERSDGTSHFDIEIGWDSFVGNEVHKYEGPFRLDDAGVWRWKVYAEDQAGNRAYYPSETQWATQTLQVNAIDDPPTIHSASFLPTEITAGESAFATVEASDPGDQITVHLVAERTDGSSHFDIEIGWDSFVGNDVHKYEGPFRLDDAGVWRWKVYAEDQAGNRAHYPSETQWASQTVQVNAMDDPPTIHSASFLPAEITAGESAVATVEASDPGDQIAVHLIAERTDGTSHFDIEIGWDSFVGNDVHKYEGPFRLDDAGVWRWKVYAEDQAGNLVYYPSETQWASQTVQVNAIDDPPNIHSASFLPTEITAGESAVATVEASDPGDQITVHLVAERTDGSSHFDIEIGWDSFVGNDVHKYEGPFRLDDAGVWRWKVYAEDQAGNRAHYPSETQWASQTVQVNAMDDPPTIHSASFLPAEITAGESAVATVEASDPGDQIAVHLIAERTDGTSHFDIEIGWDSFVGNDVHKYEGPFRLDDAGVWRWKVYAEDQAGNLVYYPSETQWASQTVQVNAIDDPPNIHSASFLPTEITAGESAVATVEASDPGDQITVHLVAERTDGSSHFDIEIGWDSFVGNDVHRYQGPFRLDDAGLWRWKVYAKDHAGNRTDWPSDGTWAASQITVTINGEFRYPPGCWKLEIDPGFRRMEHHLGRLSSRRGLRCYRRCRIACLRAVGRNRQA